MVIVHNVFFSTDFSSGDGSDYSSHVSCRPERNNVASCISEPIVLHQNWLLDDVVWAMNIISFRMLPKRAALCYAAG